MELECYKHRVHLQCLNEHGSAAGARLEEEYKKAVSADQALDIIRAEATAGRLDRDLVEIMIESQVYRRILDEGPIDAPITARQVARREE